MKLPALEQRLERLGKTAEQWKSNLEAMGFKIYWASVDDNALRNYLRTFLTKEQQHRGFMISIECIYADYFNVHSNNNVWYLGPTSQKSARFCLVEKSRTGAHYALAFALGHWFSGLAFGMYCYEHQIFRGNI